MPPPQACAKCRNCPAAEGDSWCLGCTGWEAVGRELTASWDSSGARRLASDLVVSCCRQVRALRSVTAGLTREVTASSCAGERRARRSPRQREEERRGDREERASREVPEPENPPRARAHSRVPEPAHPPPPRPRSRERVEPKQEEVSGGEEEEDEETEEEEDERKRRHSPVRSPHHRPVRDDRPRSPPGEGEPDTGLKPLGVKLSRNEESRKRDRSRDRRRDRGRDAPRGSNRRGGRKHKKLHRLAENPFLRVHRAPGHSFWELSVENPGSLDVTHLGR